MDDKKKRYVIPQVEIIKFDREDIITSSGDSIAYDSGNAEAGWSDGTIENW